MEGVRQNDYDSPWKEALETLFPEFMALLFPDIHREVDWARGYRFRDKELLQLGHDAEVGRRFVDKLVELHSRAGRKRRVLVHVEVQGQPDSAFAQRMFIYSYRLFERHKAHAVSLAILADHSKGFRPDRYYHEHWGFELSIRFPTVKLLDLGRDCEWLEQHENPFALVVLAHLKAQQSRDGAARKGWKIRLMRLCYERRYTRERILSLFRVIDWLLLLPPELEQAFERELALIEESEKMPYITSIERLGMERGRQLGLQEGMEKGVAEGRVQGVAAILLRQLERRFGSELTEAHRQRVRHADTESLLRWSDNILDAAEPNDVFR